MNQQYTTPRIFPVFPYLYVMNISVWNVFYADKYTILEVWKLSIKILGSKFLIIIHQFFATFYSAYLQLLWDKNDIQKIKSLLEYILFSLKLGQTIETHKFLAIIPKF